MASSSSQASQERTQVKQTAVTAPRPSTTIESSDQQPTRVKQPAVTAPRPSTTIGLPGHQTTQVILHRYSVLETRARGGFAEVKVCWDTRLQRKVAIKCIPLVAADAAMPTTSPDRALGEARMACMLEHDNIVRVYDFRSDNTWAYIIMDYIDGLSLEELIHRLEDSTLTYDEAAYVLQEVATALDFAHRNNILHLDIKPANILIDEDGSIKLSDFGMSELASAVGWEGARGGTVGYMPAEQISRGLVDERCDVFALAAVMWEALSGRAPFVADSADDSLAKIKRGPVPRISELDPKLEGSVEKALLNALAFSANKRTLSVLDLANSIVPVLGDTQAGLRSIQLLLEQGDVGSERERKSPARQHIPLVVRAPWLEMACIRMFTAGVCGILGYRFLGPVTSYLIGGGKIMATLLCALAGVLWPPAGSALVILGLSSSVAFISQDPTTTLVRSIVAVVILIMSGTWWRNHGRANYLSSLGLLLGLATGSSTLSVCVSALFANPVSACATSMAARVMLGIWPALASVSYEWAAMIQAVAPLVISLPFWIEVIGCGLAAAIGAFCAARGTTAAVVGQCIVGILLVVVQCSVAMVENAGIWQTPDPYFIVRTLGWVVLVSVLLVVLTPKKQSAEVI